MFLYFEEIELWNFQQLTDAYSTGELETRTADR